MLLYAAVVLGIPLVVAWVVALATVNAPADVEISDWDNGLATQRL